MIHEKFLDNLAYFFDTVYEDRQMMKWAGFLLSEHTEDITKLSKRQSEVIPRLDHMSESDMYLTYQEALVKSQKVMIQENTLSVDLQSRPLKIGFIKGIDSRGIYLDNYYILFENIKFFDLYDE